MRRRCARRPFLEVLEAREVLTTYNVGPGQALATLGAVPWNNLQPGDKVNIYWQSTPYHEKINLSASGTAAAHIQINGVAGPQGQLPVLDGDGATSSPNSPHFGYTPLQDFGLIVIYHDQNSPAGYQPSYIDINNLQLQGAVGGSPYKGYNGDARTYTAGAGGIWTEGSANVTIHGCVVTNNDNGIFAKSGGDPASTTDNITLDSNYLYGNGVANNFLYHNSYIEADGAVYQYNYYGLLRNNADGNDLKDRSAGTVIRYNYFQDGGHILDLVDAQDGAPVLTTLPSYRQTFVYGNVLVSDANGPTYLIHYGGDSGTNSNYRNGTLYFYDNTVVNQADQSQRWRTNMFELDDGNQTVDARNNIFYNAPSTPGATPTQFEFSINAGNINFGPNWVSPGWLTSQSAELGQSYSGSITGTGNFIVDPANNPGFANLATYDVHLAGGSSLAVGKGGPLASAAASAYAVTEQYVYNSQFQARPNINDLGAFAFGGTATPTLASFGVTASTSTPTAGSSFTVTVTAKDSSGNTMTGYTGTVHFTSSDGQALLPANYAFTAADAGVHTFTVTLKTAGSDGVTAADATTSSATGSATVTVSPAAASTLAVSAPPSATAGSAFSVTVTAKDAFGNVAAGYRGTVHFTSSDGQAGLPANYSFAAADNGAHTFSVTLKTAGSDSVTATDTATASVTGSASVSVSPAAAALTLGTSVSATTAGTAFSVTVTAKDSFGNTLTGYRGTVHFTSSDGQAGLPANYAFAATDNGAHTFSVTLKTAGTDSVTATDTATSSVTGSATVSVSPAGASALVIGAPASATAGNAFSVTVTAKDAYGNVATGYRGTVQFASSDAQAVLPANYAFTATDNGSHTFSVTLKTAGSKTVTAGDTAVGSVAGSGTVPVSPAAAASLTLTASATSVTAGTAFSVTLTAKDAFGNVAAGYRGTVHFTSSDGQAALPADYTFAAADNGSHTFSVTLKTTGTQSVTAADTASSGLTATQSGITVTAQTTGPGTNFARNGTAYRWWGMSSATGTTNQTKAPGLNDGNLKVSVTLSGAGTDGVGDDKFGAYEAAGVVWSSPQTVNMLTFTNGSYTSTQDGVFDAKFGLQFTTDGKTWQAASGWTLSKAYAYNSPSAGGVTYTFNGPNTAVLGFRMVGQVFTSWNGTNSWYDDATEVQAFQQATPSSAAVQTASATTPATATAGPSGLGGSGGSTSPLSASLQSASILLSAPVTGNSVVATTGTAAGQGGASGVSSQPSATGTVTAAAASGSAGSGGGSSTMLLRPHRTGAAFTTQVGTDLWQNPAAGA